MFDSFSSAYPADRDRPGTPWLHASLREVTGYQEMAAQYAGRAFGNGIYRLVDEGMGLLASELVGEAFPDFAPRIGVFGLDWLGRFFAVDDRRRDSHGEPLVLLLEIGGGNAYEIPGSFRDFHGSIAVAEKDAAFEATLFRDWLAKSGSEAPPAGSCMGFTVPLFLGGEATVDNLALTSLSAYWSLHTELLRQLDLAAAQTPTAARPRRRGWFRWQR